MKTFGPKIKTHNSIVRPRPRRPRTRAGSTEWKRLMAHLTKVRGRRCQDPEHDPLSASQAAGSATVLPHRCPSSTRAGSSSKKGLARWRIPILS
jgi:hypothetical protein